MCAAVPNDSFLATAWQNSPPSLALPRNHKWQALLMPVVLQPELGCICFWCLRAVCGGSEASAGAGISPD